MPIDPVTGAALIGAGGSILSGVSNLFGTSQANKANLELMKYQNEWNKPVNQIARLKEAGLNPNLIYGANGNVAAGGTSAPAPSMMPYRFDFMRQAGQDLAADIELKKSQAEKNRAEANQANQNVVESGTRISKMEAETEFTNMQTSLRDKLVESMDSQIALNASNAFRNNVLNILTEEETNLTKQAYDQNEQSFTFKLAVLSSEVKKNEASAKQALAEAAVAPSKILLNKALTTKAYADAKLSYALGMTEDQCRQWKVKYQEALAGKTEEEKNKIYKEIHEVMDVEINKMQAEIEKIMADKSLAVWTKQEKIARLRLDIGTSVYDRFMKTFRPGFSVSAFGFGASSSGYK
jgi:hypothetical protein